MGYIVHDTVIATTGDWRPGGLPDIAAFRESLPEKWRPLVIGPIKSISNGFTTYAFLADGSKSGWETDAEGDQYRSRFAALFDQRYDDGSTCDDVVQIGYGHDLRGDHDNPRAAYLPGGTA